MIPPGAFAFVAVGVVIIGVIAWAYLQRKRRMERMRAWADSNGWTYEEIDKRLERQYDGLRPFGRGGSRYCRHIIRGEAEGVPFVAFQYEYTVSNGKSSTTYHHVVLDLAMPLPGPGLSIQKEHWGHKMADVLGGEDIDFESDAFSRRFWVQCRDRRFAYDVIHPAMMDWLLQRPARHWQWQGRRLVVHDKGLMEIPVVKALLADALAFRGMLPRHLLA